MIVLLLDIPIDHALTHTLTSNSMRGSEKQNLTILLIFTTKA